MHADFIVLYTFFCNLPWPKGVGAVAQCPPPYLRYGQKIAALWVIWVQWLVNQLLWFEVMHIKNQIKIFHYIRCITPKRASQVCGTHFRVIAPGNTVPFEEMWQRWRAVRNTESDLTGPRLEPQTSRSTDERVTARPTDSFIRIKNEFVGLRRKYLGNSKILSKVQRLFASALC